MSIIKTETKDEKVIMTLASGVTNPINLELTHELINELKKATENEDINGLVLTSDNDKFFSIGFDIPKLLALDETGLREFYYAFNELCLRLVTLPMPTISAITGHYVAAGCILAACSDFRVLAEGKAKTGITAVKLGLPVPFLAERIVRLQLNENNANELLTTGELYDPEWAKNSGFIDKVTLRDKLLNEALIVIRNIPDIDNFKQSKKEKVMSLVKAYENNREQDEEHFISQWFSEPVQAALNEATKKF